MVVLSGGLPTANRQSNPAPRKASWWSVFGSCSAQKVAAPRFFRVLATAFALRETYILHRKAPGCPIGPLSIGVQPRPFRKSGNRFSARKGRFLIRHSRRIRKKVKRFNAYD